jgi:transcriptional regulator with XRE-family HTH domain
MARIPIDLAAQLRQAIQGTGTSLNQIARASGLDTGRLSRFMRGERDLTLSATAKLCEYLGLEFCRGGEPLRPAAPGATQRRSKNAK